VELDPNLDKCRDEVRVVIIAAICAYKREIGEPLGTVHI
jgi:hypothetical protein